MVLCDTCKHLGNMANWPCEDCLQGDRYERKPLTNADRIRAMSDEELADFMKNNFANCPDGRFSGDSRCYDCKKCHLDWLKQEVEDE